MAEPQQPANENDTPLQNYYEWQVSTLMLAYDLSDPLPPGDEQQLEQRRQAVAEEVGRLVRDLLPQEYLDDPERDFPPELMMQITRATLKRAAEVARL